MKINLVFEPKKGGVFQNPFLAPLPEIKSQTSIGNGEIEKLDSLDLAPENLRVG
jgi:hypothetical protein